VREIKDGLINDDLDIVALALMQKDQAKHKTLMDLQKILTPTPETKL